MSESNITPPPLTGFDLWTPNDYSNFITISAAAIGSTLLVIFKSRCKNISLCFGLVNCIRDVQTESDEEDNDNMGYCYYSTNNSKQTKIEKNIKGPKEESNTNSIIKVLKKNDLQLKFFKNIFKDDINLRSREKQNTNKINLLKDYQINRLSELNTDVQNEITKLDQKISRIDDYLKDPIKNSDDITLILDKISNLFISDTNINEQKAMSIYKDAQNSVKDNKSTYKCNII